MVPCGLPDDVLDDDEDDGAAQRAVEVCLDCGRSGTRRRAAAVPSEVGEPVDRAVHQILVDGRVDVRDGAPSSP